MPPSDPVREHPRLARRLKSRQTPSLVPVRSTSHVFPYTPASWYGPTGILRNQLGVFITDWQLFEEKMNECPLGFLALTLIKGIVAQSADTKEYTVIVVVFHRMIQAAARDSFFKKLPKQVAMNGSWSTKSEEHVDKGAGITNSDLRYPVARDFLTTKGTGGMVYF